MHEVVIKNEDGTRETYDCLNLTQATFVFFTARQNSKVVSVEINELVELDFID